MKDLNKTCSLCGGNIQPQYNEKGEVVWEFGHNAEPLTSGRACDACHPKVLKDRLERLGFSKEQIPMLLKQMAQ